MLLVCVFVCVDACFFSSTYMLKRIPYCDLLIQNYCYDIIGDKLS